mgnify:CR=1 FL=1
MGVTSEQIEAALRARLAPEKLQVRDDSHLHAGHAGAREGRHFSVRVVSERFAGLSRVARHRLVYDAAVELSIDWARNDACLAWLALGLQKFGGKILKILLNVDFLYFALYLLVVILRLK